MSYEPRDAQMRYQRRTLNEPARLAIPDHEHRYDYRIALSREAAVSLAQALVADYTISWDELTRMGD